MHPRKWIKGSNGLWSSFDSVIQGQVERAAIRAAKEAAKAERKRLREEKRAAKAIK